MVRRFDPEEQNRGFRPGYWIAVALIIFLWVWGFKLYFDRYEYLHPEITWAVPGIDTEIIKAKGALLWKEIPVRASASGVVSYPQGTGPVRVSRGAVVAQIRSGSYVKDIKAYQQGYFMAGVDGLESSWRYAELWPGGAPLPVPKPVTMMKDGLVIGKGQSLGKLIEQPQELRFVGYVDSVGDMPEQIKNNTLRVKMDGVDTVSKADIRVAVKIGEKTKMYLSLPWFPLEMVKSRRNTLTIEAGRTEGAVVPITSVMQKDGKYSVYLVKGSRVVLKPIEGKPIEDGKFIVTSGVSVGDAIVETASAAREGRIQLW